MVAVTLLYRGGYFRQSIDSSGQQHAQPQQWDCTKLLQKAVSKIEIPFAGRTVNAQAWKYDVRGERGHIVPVYFLDTDIAPNTEDDRRLTDRLYGGDDHYRLQQEIVLALAVTSC